MKVRELVEKLQDMDQDKEITDVDGDRIRLDFTPKQPSWMGWTMGAITVRIN